MKDILALVSQADEIKAEFYRSGTYYGTSASTFNRELRSLILSGGLEVKRDVYGLTKFISASSYDDRYVLVIEYNLNSTNPKLINMETSCMDLKTKMFTPFPLSNDVLRSILEMGEDWS